MYSPWAVHLRRNSAELLRNIMQEVQRALQRRAKEAGAAQQRHLRDRIQWINHAFGGLKEAKLLGKEPYFVQAYADSAWAYVREHRFLFIAGNVQRLVRIQYH